MSVFSCGSCTPPVFKITAEVPEISVSVSETSVSSLEAPSHVPKGKCDFEVKNLSVSLENRFILSDIWNTAHLHLHSANVFIRRTHGLRVRPRSVDFVVVICRGRPRPTD